ncbi:helix-turn-helix domain-containing protein [Streptomyces sp. NPDC002599]|uniref:helix-turn-helix domain-containing protein n=1 Tax=Streptomyces sp. NPDC002599 TaxID=3154421 RepID=UPI00331F0A0D
MGEPATLAEVRTWPALVPVSQAARALGLSRTTAFTLAAQGEFPVPVIRAVGRRQKVRTADLVRYLEASQ